MNTYLLARELSNPLSSTLKLHQTNKLWRNLHHLEDEDFAPFHAPAGVTSLDAERKENRFFISGGASGSLALWDLWKGTPHKPIVKVKRKVAHKHAVSAVIYYPVDPGMFISSSHDATVKVWDAEEMVAAHTFSLEESVSGAAMDPKGRHTLVAASGGRNVRLLDLGSGHAVGWLMGAPKDTAHTAVAWSPKEEHLCATGSDDGRVGVWDKRMPANPMIWFAAESLRHDIADKRNRGHIGVVHGLTWSEDGAHIYTTGTDKRFKCWDMSTGHDSLRKYPGLARGNGQQVVNPVLVSATQSDPQLIFITSGKDIHSVRVDSAMSEQKIGTVEDETITAIVGRADGPGLLYGTVAGNIHSLGGLGNPSQEEEEEGKRKRLDQIYQSFLENPITLP